MQNPYQTPNPIDGEPERFVPMEITFGVDAQLRRYACDQYLLYWHPHRLLIGSLIMICFSGACLAASVRWGIVAFIPTMISVMITSAVIYSALVYRTRKRIEERLAEFGLVSDRDMTLQVDIDHVKLVHSAGVHVWPNDHLQVYRTRRGLLICLEPLLFVFVPRQSDFRPGGYTHFYRMMRSRAQQS